MDIIGSIIILGVIIFLIYQILDVFFISDNTNKENKSKNIKQWIKDIDNEKKLARKTPKYYIETSELNFIEKWDYLIIEKLTDISEIHFRKGLLFKTYKIESPSISDYISQGDRMNWTSEDKDQSTESHSGTGFMVSLVDEHLVYYARRSIRQGQYDRKRLKIPIKGISKENIEMFFINVYKYGANTEWSCPSSS